MAFLHGVESDMLPQRGRVGRWKQVESSFLGLRYRQGQQCLPRPTVWETRGKATFSKCIGKPMACEMVLLMIQKERCYPLGNNCIEEILSPPTKLFTCYFSIWETGIFEQTKMEK